MKVCVKENSLWKGNLMMCNLEKERTLNDNSQEDEREYFTLQKHMWFLWMQITERMMTVIPIPCFGEKSPA